MRACNTNLNSHAKTVPVDLKAAAFTDVVLKHMSCMHAIPSRAHEANQRAVCTPTAGAGNGCCCTVWYMQGMTIDGDV
jgi:hypothetical protein